MHRTLVPVDPAEPARTRSAIEQVIRMARDEQLTACMLRVQPDMSGHITRFLDRRQLYSPRHGVGVEEPDPARAMLEAAGVPSTCTVLVRGTAPRINAAVPGLGCERIVSVREEPSPAGSLSGSLAHQVRQAMGAAASLPGIGF